MTRKISFTLTLFVLIGFITFSFSGSTIKNVSAMSQEVHQLRGEWQSLSNRTLKLVESEWDCCVIDPCLYCLLNREDGICTCARDLNQGKETCPECLGKWLEGKGSMMSWMGFQRVYPQLAVWLSSRIGPPASCPMMSGQGSSMGMMRAPMAMMRRMMGMFNWRTGNSSESFEENRVDLLMKAREIKILSNYNCCQAKGGSCIYCLIDPKRTSPTICDCKDSLKAGREICPECLGAWLNGEGNPELKENFKKVYPSLSGFIL